jgi:hypothetical protein
MDGLVQLNSWSSDDVVITVDTQELVANEGANVELPLMAWTPIHDIGNLTGNGVQITHTLQPPLVYLSDGTTLTLAQYADWLANPPVYSYIESNNATTSTLQTRYTTPSMFYRNNSQTRLNWNGSNVAATNFVVGTGDFTVEGWIYNAIPPGVTTTGEVYWYDCRSSANNGHRLIFRAQRLSPVSRWLFENIELRTGNVSTTFNTLTTGGTIFNTWMHMAVVRSSGVTRVYQNGVSVISVADTNNYTQMPFVVCGPYNSGSSGNLQEKWVNQIQYSNTARYTANFTPPTSLRPMNANVMIDVRAVDQVITSAPVRPTLTRGYLDWPPLTFPRATSNITITNPSTYVWRVTGILNPEDYLAAGAFMDFPRNYFGTGSNVQNTGTWTTNIRNLNVATYDFTYDVNLTLINRNEFTNTALADVPYDVYGNTLNDITNIVTILNETQYTLIADRANPETDIYTLTITTQDHPWKIQLDTTSAEPVSKTWYYANSVPGASGQLTLVGTRGQINAHLETLRIIKNDLVTEGNSDRPNQRQSAAYTVIESSGPAPSPPWTASTIQTQLTATPPQPLFKYCDIPNDQSSGVITANTVVSHNYITSQSTASGFYVLERSASWLQCTWVSHNNFTHEFYVKFTDVTKNCYVHTSAIGLAIYNGKLWMSFVQGLMPGQGGVADTVANRPRRIEHNVALENNTWYHVAMVSEMISTVRTFRFYVNGVNNSTNYTTGNTTTAVANTTSGFLPFDSLYWHYGGYLTMVGVNIPGTIYRLAGFNGSLSQIRASKMARYTSNFVPPSLRFINDNFTLFLHQFDVSLNPGSPVDDYQMQPLSAFRRKFTWTLTSPSPSTPQTIQQDYYQALFNPSFALMDVNYVAPVNVGMYRHAFAGRDSANNPVFVYGFKNDFDQLSLRVNKMDVFTGAVIPGPVNVISTDTITNPTIQVISNNEGMNLRQNLMANTVPIGVTNGSNRVFFGNISLENGAFTMTGNVTSPQANITQSVVYNYKSFSSANIIGIYTANVIASVFDNRAMPSNTGNTYATNANIVLDINMVGWPGASLDRVIKVSTGLGLDFVPRYQLTLASNTTNPNAGNFGSGNMFANVTAGVSGQYRVRSISISQDRVDGNFVKENRSLWCLRSRNQPGTVSEKIWLYFRAGMFRDTGIFPFATLGLERTVITGNASPQLVPLRVGGFDIVPGATSGKAWLVYNRETTASGTDSGEGTGAAAGFWYQGINIADDYSITFDLPVQVIDPAVSGNIYKPSLTAQSHVIGAFTYLHVVVGNASSDQPFEIGLRVPN